MIQLIPSIQSTRSALDAERTRVEIVSQNLANANVTRGVDGQPYKRKQVVFESLITNDGIGAPNGPPSGYPRSSRTTGRSARSSSPITPMPTPVASSVFPTSTSTRRWST